MKHTNDRWKVIFQETFDKEFMELTEEVQNNLIANAKLLEREGPHLSRPHADTLNGSKYTNMKELRFYADDGVWRVAFAFDPKRQAILLVAGDKSGSNQKSFYKSFIKKADKRFNDWLDKMKGG